ncbi:hypothetical protein D3C76_889870 [compost metagenome]
MAGGVGTGSAGDVAEIVHAGQARGVERFGGMGGTNGKGEQGQGAEHTLQHGSGLGQWVGLPTVQGQDETECYKLRERVKGCAICLSRARFVCPAPLVPVTAGALPLLGRHNYRPGVAPWVVMVPFPKGEAQDAHPRRFHRHLYRQPVARMAGQRLSYPPGRAA